ncbi:TetR/AcrR family transcriptional regulator [Evansella sp. AB-rgal1]|uniref:TetR/AcrR family transcriptional regulator n=1 Tax=Evansella sp. AB-rgal1 TaxID=3242696 RepID=UPI00359D76F7
MSTQLDRRRQLMDSALEEFATNGYYATKIASIVERTGVAQGTFYWHFKSKKEIALAILAEGEQALLNVIESGYRKEVGTVTEMLDSSQSLMTHLFTFAKENRDLMKLLFLTGQNAEDEILDLIQKINQDLEDAFNRNIHRATDLGMLEKRDSKDLRGTMLTNLVKGMIQRWLFNQNENQDSISSLNPEDIAKEVVYFEFYGLLGASQD